MDTFKNSLDTFWQDQEVLYNWKADICTGSRSQVSQCYFRLINKPLLLCYARSGHRGLLDLRSDIFSTTTTTTTAAAAAAAAAPAPAAPGAAAAAAAAAATTTTTITTTTI